MKEDIKARAEETRALYRMGVIDRKEAKERIKEYEAEFNAACAKIAAKYKKRPYKFNFNAFMR